MTLNQVERIVYFHKLIREGHYPSSKSIIKHFDVTPRTAYRNIKLLRSRYKAPLVYDRLKHGYYYGKQNWNLFE